KSTWEDVNRSDIIGILYMLKDDGESAATIDRAISSSRLVHQFLIREQLVHQDPSIHIETPQRERSVLDRTSPEDVEKLRMMNGDTRLNLRNKAMLELLYATGLRVTELLTLNVSDLHLTMGFVRCLGKGSKERIVPLGNVAKDAVEVYLSN